MTKPNLGEEMEGRATLIRMVMATVDTAAARRWLEIYAKSGWRVEGLVPYGSEDDPFAVKHPGFGVSGRSGDARLS